LASGRARVRRQTLQESRLGLLAASDQVTLDDDVLFAASFLHDMAAFAPWEKKKVDHSDEAARIVAGVLQEGGEPTGPDAVKMLEENLAKVPSRVLSPAGRAMVAPRSAELQQFLAELRRESADLATL
jgi:hypothetical protein